MATIELPDSSVMETQSNKPSNAVALNAYPDEEKEMPIASNHSQNVPNTSPVSASTSALRNREPRLLHFDTSGHFDPPENKEGGLPFDGNRIKTSKYTPITFVPLNLWEQITRPANFYFCMVAVLQAIPQVSITQGRPTILLPLITVFTVTAIKDVLEDLKRHREDDLENKREVEILKTDGTYERALSEDLKVGNIVRVKDTHRFPADLLLISSAKGHTSPYCWVETSNIDGETNLKLKQCPEGFNSLPCFDDLPPAMLERRASLLDVGKDKDVKTSSSFDEFKKRIRSITLQSDPPDGHLDQFSGMLKNIRVPILNDEVSESDFNDLEYDVRNITVGIDNLLLRGSELRNSDWIYGLVLYTGFESKIFMNNQSRSQRKIKRSSIEQRMNRYIYTMACAQFLVCALCATFSGDWLRQNADAWYLDYNLTPVVGGIYKFFTWFIIFAQFIPISLLVSMEMVKYAQAHFMQWDISMYARIAGQDKYCDVQNSNLNEELGQIQYIFSDKTGTLTENSLDFRKCVIGSENFGKGQTEIGRAARRREAAAKSDTNAPEMPRKISEDEHTAALRQNNAPHVNFDEFERMKQRIFETTQDNPPEQAVLVKRFLTCLAINNSCYPVYTEDSKELEIRAASPDDECLTCFANFMGVQLAERNPPRITLKIFPQIEDPSFFFEEQWEQLAELEFTSKRKRMSLIVRNTTTGNIHFTMKGADSEMEKVIKDYHSHTNYEYSNTHLNLYSNDGLRTLVIGEAILPAEWWDAPNGWAERYSKFQEDTLMGEDTEAGHMKGTCGTQCRKCAWYDSIEHAANIDLLGVTAIEDKLQSGVPETISALLSANIRVWVLTGDKQKTAENIGIACNLLEPGMFKKKKKNENDRDQPQPDTLLFQLTKEEDLSTQMTNAIEKIKLKKNENRNAGLVLNSTALAAIMTQPEMEYEEDNEQNMRAKFLELATLCKSVIGVRLQPNQKAQVINFIKKETRCVTMGVGDGANDEPMIRTANVGVGIAGLEGTAAVRASDYAIARFKYLKNLLFVHGKQDYRRIAMLICYIFYKNGLLSLSSFWYGFYNGFSGQILYIDWAYQLYNVAFTGVPILLYAVVDRVHSDAYLMRNPRLYADTQQGTLFNARIFFAWIGESLMASCLLTLIPIQCYNITSMDETGQSSGIWSTGLAAMTAIVSAANFRLAFITTSWSGWTHFVIWGSLISYFLCIFIFSSTSLFAMAGADYYFLIFRLMRTWRYWLTVILSTVIALFIPFTYVSFTELRKRTQHMSGMDSVTVKTNGQ